MIRVLFGRLRYRYKYDLILLPLKYLYILYSFPVLIFAAALAVRSGGALGNPRDEEVGPIKGILLHVAVVFLSFVIWGIIYTIATGQ